jgi:hypothetical protein
LNKQISKQATTTTKSKQIAKVFLINNVSATLIIPAEIARKKGIDHPSHVTVEEVEDGQVVEAGILIKKLDLD